MNMAQADALIQRYPYLTSVTLRQGVVDFAQNIPPADTALVATKAMLLVRDDLHPALITVLAQAIREVQSQPSLKEYGGIAALRARRRRAVGRSRISDTGRCAARL